VGDFARHHPTLGFAQGKKEWRYVRRKKKEAALKSRPYTVGVEVEIEEAGFRKPALHGL